MPKTRAMEVFLSYQKGCRNGWSTPSLDARKTAGDRCYYCGKKSKLTLDHFEPLAKGGAHCVSNFVFACFSCNSRKRDLDPFDFMASNVAVWL